MTTPPKCRLYLSISATKGRPTSFAANGAITSPEYGAMLRPVSAGTEPAVEMEWRYAWG